MKCFRPQINHLFYFAPPPPSTPSLVYLKTPPSVQCEHCQAAGLSTAGFLSDGGSLWVLLGSCGRRELI